MNLRNIIKFTIIGLFALLINTTYIKTVYADDHTPKRKLISELKEEITDLGGTPVKRKHLLSSLQKWIDELEAQLEKLKKIDALKAEILKELEALGEKPLSNEAKELEADEEIKALRKLLEDVKAKKKEAEEKKKKDAKLAEEKKKKEAKISVAIEMLKDELAALGEEPIIDTSDIDSDEKIKALKKQIKDIKEKRKAEKAEADKKAKEEAKAEERKQTRLDAIETVRKEILFLGETPMAEYEFTSEDKFIAALREQLEEIKKIKEEEEFKINAEIPEWYQTMPQSSETIMFARGSAISADLDNSEQRAVENALIKLSTQMKNRISSKTNLVIKEAGVDADLTLKTEMQRISNIVVKNATIRGYKIFKTKMAMLVNGKYRTFVVIEFPVSLAYKNFIADLDNSVTVKAEVNKLKNTEAFKELEQYVAEFSGA
jgi:DNA repair exonuclease SbcCD ATPase subunit